LTTNVAVIGFGKMGILHSGVVNAIPDCQVRAICEREGLLVKVARAVLPKSIVFYKDHLEMLAKEELDAIFVTTPIHTHVPLITDIARNNEGLSIFVEKPLAATYEQAQTACDAVSNLTGMYMVGFQKRFSPVFQRAREFIKKALLGELLFFRAYSFSSDILSRGSSWRSRKGTGGVLLDLAPHLLDILLWFFGEPSTIESVRRRIYSDDVDDYVHAVMSFKSGMKGSIDACWCIKNYRLPEISIEVYGEKGVMTVSDDFVRLTESGKRQTLYRQSFDTSVSFLLADPEYTMQDEAFLAGVRSRVKPRIDFSEAAKVNAIIDRINETAERVE
jgi:predicted dehydrogenase